MTRSRSSPKPTPTSSPKAPVPSETKASMPSILAGAAVDGFGFGVGIETARSAFNYLFGPRKVSVEVTQVPYHIKEQNCNSIKKQFDECFKLNEGYNERCAEMQKEFDRCTTGT
jgi:hypothetical protein